MLNKNKQQIDVSAMAHLEVCTKVVPHPLIRIVQDSSADPPSPLDFGQVPIGMSYILNLRAPVEARWPM